MFKLTIFGAGLYGIVFYGVCEYFDLWRKWQIKKDSPIDLIRRQEREEIQHVKLSGFLKESKVNPITPEQTSGKIRALLDTRREATVMSSSKELIRVVDELQKNPDAGKVRIGY